MHSFWRLAAVAALSLTAAACASAPPADYGDYGGNYARGGEADVPSAARIERPSHPLQCVAYARARSHIDIYGDAWTWWSQAAGRYPRTDRPARGAVMVLDGYAGPHRAHLAYVRRVVSGRLIRVDHANWLDRGNVHLDDPVRDVSVDNDWSEVRVFDLKTGAWGGHVYHVRGFIDPNRNSDMRLADRD